MLEQVVRAKHVLRRLRAGPLGGELDHFVSDMQSGGYSARTIRDYVREVDELARWMLEEGAGVDALDPSTVERFLVQRFPSSVRARRKAQAAVRRLTQMLRGRGVVASAPPSAASGSDILVRQFGDASLRLRGLSSSTREQQGRYVREFLVGLSRREAPIDPTTINARDLMEFVAARARLGKLTAAKRAATALRAFMRFLALKGLCAATLADSIPTIRQQAHRPLRHLRPDEVRQLLASFDRSCPIGQRDYTMALCMVQLGLRVGEVVRLTLEDVDWRDGTLRVSTSKSRHAACLPLLAGVGSALSVYIRTGRPDSRSRHVFLTHAAPLGRPLDASAARATIRRAFVRSGLQVTYKGTHSLRHTLATTMVSQGASLKEIADVLRHRSLDTTVIYARVDLANLRSVVMPWPEASS